jgi:hypothetical protein
MANRLVRVPRRLERCRSLLEEIADTGSRRALISLLANLDTEGRAADSQGDTSTSGSTQ